MHGIFKVQNNESEDNTMKKNNIIDLQNYFEARREVCRQETDALTVQKVMRTAGRILDVASSVAIAACLSACLLLFFTML